MAKSIEWLKLNKFASTTFRPAPLEKLSPRLKSIALMSPI